MGFNIKPMTMVLVALSALSTLPCPDASCGGSCAVSGGASYNFMSDPAFNIGMSSLDEFVRDSLAQMPLSRKSLSSVDPLNNNSSLKQTADDNSSQSGLGVLPVINNQAIATSDNSTFKLGASGMQDKRVSNLVFATFNNKF